MHDYVKEILSTRYEDNVIRAKELEKLIRSNSIEQSSYFDKNMELRREVIKFEDLLNAETDSTEISEIAKEALEGKILKKRCEIEKYERLIKVSKELREEYMYELYSMVEENQDIDSVLNIICEDKKIKEPLLNEFGDSAGSLNKLA